MKSASERSDGPKRIEMVFPPRSPEADKPASCPDCGRPVSRYWNGYPMPCEDKSCKEGREIASREVARQGNVHSVRGGIPEHYATAEPRLLGFDLPDSGPVLFYGPVGRGKTFAAAAYAVKLARQMAIRNVAWFSVPSLLIRIRATFGNKAVETEKGIFDSLVAADLLVLDDLGAEKVTDFSISTLYAIVSERMNRNDRPTVVTTNLSMDALEKFDQRLFSRMASWRRMVVNGPDRRAGGDRRAGT